MQYGLCHPSGDFSYGLHTTFAANSYGDPSISSKHRLLEEVAPVTLSRGSVAGLAGLETDASFVQPGIPLEYNRLADRSVGWVLIDTATIGLGAQAAVELVLGLMGGNLTILPPGRMCNTSSGLSQKIDPLVSAALSAGVQAARAALVGFAELGQSNVPVAEISRAVQRAGEVLMAHGERQSGGQ